MRISDVGIIELCELKFHAFHGCLPEEQRDGNIFLVDFRAKVPISRAAESDRLADAVDLKSIYDVISREMQQRSDLLECVAGRIADAVTSAFPEIIEATVTVSKKCPPLGGECSWSRVTVTSINSNENSIPDTRM